MLLQSDYSLRSRALLRLLLYVRIDIQYLQPTSHRANRAKEKENEGMFCESVKLLFLFSEVLAAHRSNVNYLEPGSRLNTEMIQ